MAADRQEYSFTTDYYFLFLNFHFILIKFILSLNHFFSRSASKIHRDELPLVFQIFC